MKIISSAIFVGSLLFAANYCNAQTINWSGLSKKDRHIASLSAGTEYAFVFGAGYGYQLQSKRPVILNAAFSIPAGNNIFDDYKTKIGAQICWFKKDDFYFSTNTQAVFRQYTTDYATLLNFGSDISAIAGYYKHNWFAAAEIGFDKAIVTHFRHTDLYKANYPGVKDGWYEPPSGGNFYYGIQAGYSIHQTDICLKAGKITAQDFNTSPSLPLYAQLGVNVKLKSK
jgi:hypothetical protein